MTDDPTRSVLVDLIELTETAAQLVARGRPAYDDDQMLRLAAEAIIQRIGECATRLSRISPELVQNHPEVPWASIRGTRNLVAHAYERIDYEILWNALARSSPDLRRQFLAILEAGDTNRN